MTSIVQTEMTNTNTASPASFTAPRKDLLAALKSLAHVIPSRTWRDDLKCVTLGINGTVDLSTTDLEITSRLIDATWERSGDAVARFEPKRAIACLAGSKAPDATMTIDSTAGALRVSCGASIVSIPLDAEQPAEHLPTPAAGELLFTIDVAELRRAVELTEFATDVKSTRYALGGMQIEPGDRGITFCSTDARRLSVYHAAGEVSAETFGYGYDGAPIPGVVLPSKFWCCLSRSLPKTGTVEILATVRENELPPANENGEQQHGPPRFVRTYSASCGPVRIETLPVEGRFPNYRGVIPSATEFSLTVSADELGEAVKAAKTGTSAESRAVEFAFAPGSSLLRLEGKSIDSAARSQCAIIESGGMLPEVAFSIFLDPDFIADACKPFKRETITMEFIDDERLVSIRSGEFLHIVMPLARETIPAK